jgi:CheY-like chemotaxis protein
MQHQHVLVVDDEPGIREYIVGVLQSAGLITSEAADGPAALQAIAGGGKFNLLLTDIQMPGFDGFELFRRAKECDPDLRVLYMSAYAGWRGLNPDREDFLPKPFRTGELLGCVFEILRRKVSRR